MQHVSNLIEASQILYDARKYYAAIPLAILALEESYKILLFQQHLMSKQGISEQRWQRISRGDVAHRNKLTSIYADGKADIKNQISKEKYDQVAAIQRALYGTEVIPYEVAKASDDIGMERLSALNEVKKNCFYLHWDDPDWSSLYLSTSESEQEAIASIEINSARFMLVGAMRWLKWPIIPQPGTPEFSSFENDDIMKADKALHELLKLPEYQQKIAIANSVLDRYRKRTQSRK